MLGLLDGLAIVAYFLVLLLIGWRIMVRARGAGALGSFLAADRNMGLVQTTASTAGQHCMDIYARCLRVVE